MIRPIVAETKRYGEYSLPHEFNYDRPFQWGSRRIGPDLQREGGARASLWHWQHLENPRNPEAGAERSVMPSFAHLHRRKIDFDKIPERVQATKTFGAPFEFEVSDSADIARKQAESVAADIVSMGGPILNGANGGAMPAWKSKLSVNEIVLVSSYVASLRGTTPATAKAAEGNKIAPWPK